MDSALLQLRGALDVLKRDGEATRQLESFVKNLENNPTRDPLAACVAALEPPLDSRPDGRLVRVVCGQVLCSHQHGLFDHRHAQWLEREWNNNRGVLRESPVFVTMMSLDRDADRVVDDFFKSRRKPVERDATVDAFFRRRERAKA